MERHVFSRKMYLALRKVELTLTRARLLRVGDSAWALIKAQAKGPQDHQNGPDLMNSAHTPQKPPRPRSTDENKHSSGSPGETAEPLCGLQRGRVVIYQPSKQPPSVPHPDKPPPPPSLPAPGCRGRGLCSFPLGALCTGLPLTTTPRAAEAAAVGTTFPSSPGARSRRARRIIFPGGCCKPASPAHPVPMATGTRRG